MHNWVKTGRILLAGMFILSAVSKMLSLPFFDGLVAELLIGEDYYNHAKPLFYTQLLTRFLIAVELVLGMALLQNRWMKRLVLPGAMLMLVVFTVHLVYSGLQSEKGFVEGNCGCFGDILPMNNLESILKNVAAMILGIFIWIKYKHTEHMRFAGWVGPAVLGAITLMTLLLTVKSYDSNDDEIEDVPSEVTIDTTAKSNVDTALGIVDMGTPPTADETPKQPVTSPAQPNPNQDNTPGPVISKTAQVLSNLPKLSDGSKLNVQKGKTLICMFSMTCSHCQEIYKEICDAKDGGWPRIVLLNFGKDFEQKYFFNQAGNHQYPHILTEDYIKFNKWLEGEGFPRILAMEDGQIKGSWNLDSYSKESLFGFYGIKEVEKDNGFPLKKKEDSGIDSKNPWD